MERTVTIVLMVIICFGLLASLAGSMGLTLMAVKFLIHVIGGM